MNNNLKRNVQTDRLKAAGNHWDILVAGGGATGLGIALDAALRGYSVALLEAGDFASGTSSRSTKLVHGGVRYLAKGDLGLVIEALHERGLLQKNAPELVRNQSFIIPAYRWWEGPFYAIGLTLYDLLAGRLSFGRSHFIGRKKVLESIPTLNPRGLKGGVLYHDGQFDDALLAIRLAQAAAREGACVVNYIPVETLLKDKSGKVCGVTARDLETNEEITIHAGCVINATGVFADKILQMDQPAAPATIRPSQGVHLVLDKSFLPGTQALMIPKTSDGRVLFAIPWRDHVVVGTTDTLVSAPSREPVALPEEISFILETAGRYLVKPPGKSDVLSVFAGQRPLTAPREGKVKTREISRRHKILVSGSGLITIIGGKWTTYRRMAKDCLDRAIRSGLLPPAACTTASYQIFGMPAGEFPGDELLLPGYPYTSGMVRNAVHQEMARTLEDVLSRRLRVLITDARASLVLAEKVASIMAEELGRDEKWKTEQLIDYKNLTMNYIIH
ncbi:MAG: glycerol-3-phosphate dehydrogenase/oxidase [Bacteroidales bacterium]